ncbi:NAD-dependent protein deacetylase [Pseudonocardiaceae bacterium YIM PH 21723]|nr:NAD-dependent protein deacetylase [Pseudonocardiaceae bacterium YIM PH 21723]
MSDSNLEQAAELIASADGLLICAGAGMGVDSGLPDFRGDEGFWRAYPPYARVGMRFEELADPIHFIDDPRLAWGFYGHRLHLYRDTVPHDGFRLLRDWAANKELGAMVFTSNVDGAFQKAGFAEDLVVECHGSIHHLQCQRDCPDIWSADPFDIEVDESTMRATGALPSCDCDDPARPNILMFGDYGWREERTQAQMNRLTEWRRLSQRRPIAVLELGAGTAVPTVRRQAEFASAATGSLIRINVREPEVRHGWGVPLQLGALEALTALDELL